MTSSKIPNHESSSLSKGKSGNASTKPKPGIATSKNGQFETSSLINGKPGTSPSTTGKQGIKSQTQRKLETNSTKAKPTPTSPTKTRPGKARASKVKPVTSSPTINGKQRRKASLKDAKEETLVPVKKPKCKIKAELKVIKVLNRKFKIPEDTKNRHLYFGNDPLDGKKAIEISENRGSEFTEKSKRNTVFDKPQTFWFCKTDHPDNPNLAISSEAVPTFQCFYIENKSKWIAQYLGTFNAIFGSRGYHYPSLLYKNIVFPEKKKQIKQRNN